MMERNNKYFEAEDDESLTDKILEFAREYQSGDFPNPDRKECPLREELTKIAVSGELPEVKLRQHLLNCSPCFLDFQSARTKKTAALAVTASKAKSASWLGYFRLSLPVAALFLLVCSIIGLILYGLRTKPKTEFGEKTDNTNRIKNEQPLNNQTSSPDVTNSQTENRESEKTKALPKQNNQLSAPNKVRNSTKADSEKEEITLAKNTIKLDLAKSTVLRNETSRETIFTLPSKIVTLDIKLIANSPAGDYEVSLFNESADRTIIISLTKKSNGKNLRINLDLRNKSGRARLCIAPTGEIPDCFAVSIGQGK